jgi:type IV pilus assembly protein PilV
MDHIEKTMATRGRHQASSGFSLLEVLIALVILSVGLLGIAALISTALKSNSSAYMRTQATALAYNIIDRMRANLPAVNNGSYNLAMPGAPSAATIPTVCTTSTCSSGTLATYDIGQWEYDLAHQLPQGRGSISNPAPSTTDGLVTVVITVKWNDSRAHDSLQRIGAPSATSFNLSVSSALP